MRELGRIGRQCESAEHALRGFDVLVQGGTEKPLCDHDGNGWASGESIVPRRRREVTSKSRSRPKTNGRPGRTRGVQASPNADRAGRGSPAAGAAAPATFA